ncbi:MAG: VanZ family protein [Terriglobales bacterium]
MTTSQIKQWIPATIWASLILLASSDTFSAAHTRSILENFFQWLFPSWTPYSVYKAHLVIRKCAHFFEYAVLAIFVMRGFAGDQTQGPSTPVRRGERSLRMTMLGVVVLCAMVATIDEVHQHFVPSRTGSPYDVLLDTAGSTVAMLLLTRRKSSRVDQKTA